MFSTIFLISSKIENKNPRPSNGNVFDIQKRPSSAGIMIPVSAEEVTLSPELASLILAQQRPMNRPLKPVKMEVKPEAILPTPLLPMSSQKQIFGLNFPNFFEPQQRPPVIVTKPINSEPIQVINDRFYSPIYESKVQENAAFFQNSKLHKFFHSPHYIQNIYGKFVMDSEGDDGEMTNAMPIVDEEPLVGVASPLTKEAIWYKDYVNKKRVRNVNDMVMRDYRGRM